MILNETFIKIKDYLVFFYLLFSQYCNWYGF